MFIRYLGFVLLIWFPGGLHAQDATQSCVAPRLDGGLFSPKQDTYSHGTKLTYTCENGRKPAVKGWWASSTCQNGKWSHEPRCIDEKACFAPTILNANNYTKNQDGWYEEGNKIRITCDTGYQPKNNDATAICRNGTWSSVPVCESRGTGAGTVEDEKACFAPTILNANYTKNQDGWYEEGNKIRITCDTGYQPKNNDATAVCRNGTWSSVPVCERPSTNSGLNDSKPLFTTIHQCGSPPKVLHGVVMEESLWSLTYKCNIYYKLMGPDTVACYSDGTWSEVPTCAVWFCSVNTDEDPKLIPKGVIYIKYGETVELECKDEHSFKNVSVAKCTDGILTVSRCCNRFQINTNLC